MKATLTVTEAMTLLGCCRSTVYARIWEGKLEYEDGSRGIRIITSSCLRQTLKTKMRNRYARTRGWEQSRPATLVERQGIAKAG